MKGVTRVEESVLAEILKQPIEPPRAVRCRLAPNNCRVLCPAPEHLFESRRYPFEEVLCLGYQPAFWSPSRIARFSTVRYQHRSCWRYVRRAQDRRSIYELKWRELPFAWPAP